MSRHVTRRRFLELAVAGCATTVATACGATPTPTPIPPTPTSVPPTPTAKPTTAPAAPTVAPAAPTPTPAPPAPTATKAPAPTPTTAPAVKIKEGGTMRFRHPAVPPDMDPLNWIGGARLMYTARYMAATGSYDQNLGAADWLCTNKWVSDTAIELEVHAKANWHDGKPVTSKDVEFTIKRLLNPATASSSNGAIWSQTSLPDSLKTDCMCASCSRR